MTTLSISGRSFVMQAQHYMQNGSTCLRTLPFSGYSGQLIGELPFFMSIVKMKNYKKPNKQLLDEQI